MKTSLIIRRGIAAAVFGCALACVAPAHAQELNCTVEVNSSQVSGTNKSMFETLQSAINDYMNTTVFTNSQFGSETKRCRLFFTIKEVDNDKLIGDLQVQSTRPRIQH